MSAAEIPVTRELESCRRTSTFDTVSEAPSHHPPQSTQPSRHVQNVWHARQRLQRGPPQQHYHVVRRLWLRLRSATRIRHRLREDLGQHQPRPSMEGHQAAIHGGRRGRRVGFQPYHSSNMK